MARFGCQQNARGKQEMRRGRRLWHCREQVYETLWKARRLMMILLQALRANWGCLLLWGFADARFNPPLCALAKNGDTNPECLDLTQNTSTQRICSILALKLGQEFWGHLHRMLSSLLKWAKQHVWTCMVCACVRACALHPSKCV